MRRRALPLALLLALLGAASGARAEEPRRAVLVVAAASPVQALDALAVRKLFLGFPVVAGGRPLQPVRRRGDVLLEEVFLQHGVALSAEAYDRRLLSQLLRQGRPRPLEARSFEQLRAALLANPQAVGYAWSTELPGDGSLRVVRTLWSE